MAINKVVYDGNTLIDLTSDTVTAGDLRQGITATNRAGVQITGTLDVEHLFVIGASMNGVFTDVPTPAITFDQTVADAAAAAAAGYAVILNLEQTEDGETFTDTFYCSRFSEDSLTFVCDASITLAEWSIGYYKSGGSDAYRVEKTPIQEHITASGILKGDGYGIVSAAVPGTDYVASTTTAKISVQGTAPTSPSAGDIWIDTSQANIQRAAGESF